MEAWNNWFASIADHIVDPGNPLGPGLEISSVGARELPLNLDAITGYTIINAADREEAEKIAKECPSITSIRLYEIRTM